jgi:hypothetical protein
VVGGGRGGGGGGMASAHGREVSRGRGGAPKDFNIVEFLFEENKQLLKENLEYRRGND